MKLLADFFPILLFFIAYKMYDIYIATAVAIVAALGHVAYSYAKHKKVEKMQWITLGLILVFGGLTLAFRDPTFIMWKPSIVNLLFALAFLGSQYIGEKSFIERMMGSNISLPKQEWTKLNLSWVLFFTFLAVINLYVAYSFSEDTWVNFKLFGMMGLTFVFIIIQGLYLSRLMKNGEPETEEN